MEVQGMRREAITKARESKQIKKYRYIFAKENTKHTKK